eukprot:GHVU01074198.1.p1 GENE.GHVU01074198.1~~GHVU01074198.1.p1  ORF type:complete len:119 (+),score=2.35 GHVU01074198.1:263-619(+)
MAIVAAAGICATVAATRGYHRGRSGPPDHLLARRGEPAFFAEAVVVVVGVIGVGVVVVVVVVIDRSSTRCPQYVSGLERYSQAPNFTNAATLLVFLSSLALPCVHQPTRIHAYIHTHS